MNDPTVKRFEKIESTLAGIGDALLAIAKNLPEKVTPKVLSTKKPKQELSNLPIPKEWRAILDEMLGVDFKASVQGNAVGDFSMLVVFPKEIDRRGSVEKNDKEFDESMFSPIRRVSPEDDVRKWCKLTVSNIKKCAKFSNFTPKLSV